jgi:hypothetical protein
MADRPPRRVGPGADIPDNAPLRFEKADFQDMLSGAAKVLNGLITRQMVDVADGRTESPDLKPDDSLMVLDELVQGFTSGKDLEKVRSEVDRLTMAQDDRMTLVTSLVTQHSLVRMVRLMVARDRLERFMVSAAERGDLTPSEALVFLKTISTDMAEIQDSIKPTAIKDAKGLVDKVDYSQKKAAATASAKYDDTSPQGREIIRKIVYGLIKQVGERKPTSSTGLGGNSKGLTAATGQS